MCVAGAAYTASTRGGWSPVVLLVMLSIPYDEHSYEGLAHSLLLLISQQQQPLTFLDLPCPSQL